MGYLKYDHSLLVVISVTIDCINFLILPYEYIYQK